MGVKLGLTFRKENGLRVNHKRVMKRKLGWRELHNEELCNLYSSPNIIRIIKLWRMR
jgi:hypothetical protein